MLTNAFGMKFAGEVEIQNNKIRSVHIERPFRLEWMHIPDLVVLAGKNGSGKSRLLEFLNDKFRQHQRAAANAARNRRECGPPMESIYWVADESMGLCVSKYSEEYEQALARDFVEHLKSSKIYRASFLNDVREFLRSRDDSFFNMYFHRDICKKIALEITKLNSDPNDANWREDANMAIDRFSHQMDEAPSSPAHTRQALDPDVSPQPFARPMNYMMSLVDGFNNNMAEFMDRLAKSTSPIVNNAEWDRLESERAKLVLLFNNINGKLVKYSLPYKFDWVEYNDYRTELRFVNTMNLINQVVCAHFSTRKQKYQGFRSLINQFTVRGDESSLDSSPLFFYGEFSSSEKLIFDLIAWTSLIEEEMINVGLILLDEPDAHLNSASLETLIHLIKGLFLNCAVNAKTVQVMLTTNRVEFVRLLRKHVSQDFSRVGLDLKKRITKSGEEEIERVDERVVRPIRAEIKKVYGATSSQENYIDLRSYNVDQEVVSSLSSKIDDLADKLQGDKSVSDEVKEIKQSVDKLSSQRNYQEKNKKKLIIYR